MMKNGNQKMQNTPMIMPSVRMAFVSVSSCFDLMAARGVMMITERWEL